MHETIRRQYEQKSHAFCDDGFVGATGKKGVDSSTVGKANKLPSFFRAKRMDFP
jgi:hypothetical protein